MLVSAASHAPVPDEGKTTVALSLARVCARGNKKVLLVDCDFRRPSVRKALGFEQVRPRIKDPVLEERAKRQVQATLLVEKIAQKENIEASDKDVQERVDHLARAAGDKAKTVREFYSRADARDELRAQIVFDRTLNFLLEKASVKDVDSKPVKVDEEGKKS